MQTQNPNTHLTGIVYKKNLGHYDVHHHDQVINCVLSANLWKSFETTEGSESRQGRVVGVNKVHMDPVAVGDRVSFIPAEDGTGMILEVLSRRNYLARESAKPMPGAHAHEQVIAANLDQVIPVFAVANPDPKWHMLDRYLVTAESYDIPSLIVITKMDLVQGTRFETELSDVVERYRKIGYPVLLTSSVDNKGVDQLRRVLSGRISVLLGKSGVGKTSLLN